MYAVIAPNSPDFGHVVSLHRTPQAAFAAIRTAKLHRATGTTPGSLTQPYLDRLVRLVDKGIRVGDWLRIPKDIVYE